jgi:hypothetical protein
MTHQMTRRGSPTLVIHACLRFACGSSVLATSNGLFHLHECRLQHSTSNSLTMSLAEHFSSLSSLSKVCELLLVALVALVRSAT